MQVRVLLRNGTVFVEVDFCCVFSFFLIRVKALKVSSLKTLQYFAC